jgi:DNA replication protein DnaC
MLNQPTLEKLQTMKLHGMADAFRAQLETTDTSQLSFEERFAMLVDQQWLWKENRALARRLRAAKRQHQNLLLIGPTGIGKTWLGCALAQKACRDGFTILHKRAAELFRDLAVAHVDGSFGRQLVKHVLRPAVGVVNECLAASGPAFLQCLFQGIQNKVGMRRPTHPPADDPASVCINDKRHIDEAVDLIQRTSDRFVAACCANGPTANDSLQAHLPHQPSYCAARDSKSFPL